MVGDHLDKGRKGSAGPQKLAPEGLARRRALEYPKRDLEFGNALTMKVHNIADRTKAGPN